MAPLISPKVTDLDRSISPENSHWCCGRSGMGPGFGDMLRCARVFPLTYPCFDEFGYCFLSSFPSPSVWCADSVSNSYLHDLSTLSCYPSVCICAKCTGFLALRHLNQTSTNSQRLGNRRRESRRWLNSLIHESRSASHPSLPGFLCSRVQPVLGMYLFSWVHLR